MFKLTTPNPDTISPNDPYYAHNPISRVRVIASDRYGAILSADDSTPRRYLVSFWYATGDESIDGWFTESELEIVG